MYMNKQVLDILQEQEEIEKAAYQSTDAIVAMMEKDFSNSGEVLQAINRYYENLSQLFQTLSCAQILYPVPLPVRKCDFFHVSKHTLSQVPYLHTHEYFEFIYVIQGNCKQYLEEPCRPLFLKTHQSCLLPPGVKHIMEKCSEKDIILKFAISVNLYRDVIEPIVGGNIDDNVLIFHNNNLQIDYCIYMLLKESRQQCEHYERAVKCYLSLLFIESVRKPMEKYSDIILKLRDYFEANLNQINLHDFALQMGYTDDYTGRLIKNNVGKSFKEIVLELKANKCAELLRETDYPIEFISEMLGYANPSGMYKQFLRIYGMTPNSYRKVTRQL